MVGRFVQQQKIASLEKETGQNKTGLFAAGKFGYLTIKIFLTKKKETEDAHQLFFGGAGIGKAADFSKNGGVRAQGVHLMLGIVAHADLRAAHNIAAAALQRARKQLEQR